MFNLAVTFIAAALLAPSAAVGQATLSPCVTNCSTLALPAGPCDALTDLACVCSSTGFLGSAAACIAQDCPDELESATATQTEACAAVANGTDTSTSDAGTDSSTSAAVVTPGGTASTTRGTVTPGATTRPATTSSSSRSTSSTATNSTGAGFHTASIASGVTLALFGAAFSLF